MTLPAAATDPVRVGGGDINEAWCVLFGGSYRAAAERVAESCAG